MFLDQFKAHTKPTHGVKSLAWCSKGKVEPNKHELINKYLIRGKEANKPTQGLEDILKDPSTVNVLTSKRKQLPDERSRVLE